MLRRELPAALSAFAACTVGRAHGSASLEPFFESREGAGVLLDVRSRRTIAMRAAAVADGFLAPPGSTVKPFVLAALLRDGKLSATEAWPCPGRLTIGGRSFDCSHPQLDFPMRVETAIAYSCNCFVARVAERLASSGYGPEYGWWRKSSRSAPQRRWARPAKPDARRRCRYAGAARRQGWGRTWASCWPQRTGVRQQLQQPRRGARTHAGACRKRCGRWSPFFSSN